MLSTEREALRFAIDAARRGQLVRAGSPHKRPEEQPIVESPGSWMPMLTRPRQTSPFYCLATYEGEVC